MKIIFAQFAIILLIACVLAELLTNTLQAWHTAIFQTTTELICIFIMLSSFFTVWYTYNRNPPLNHVIGFGFLMVAFFDLFHILYYQGFILYPPVIYDLSARYWILGRFAEALVLLICSLGVFHFRVNKWAGLLFSLTLALGSSYLINRFTGLMPVLYTAQGPTQVKIFLECIIITIYFAGLYHLRNKVNSRDILTYRCLYLALLFAIPAELCFTLFPTLTPFYNTLGHILKATCYYCLFRGIFVSGFTFPYEKLEEAGKYMAEVLNGLPIGLVTFDSSQRLSFANSKALELSGCREEELIGLKVGQLAKRFCYKENGEKLVFARLSRGSRPVRNRIMAIKSPYGLKKVNVDARKLDSSGWIFLFTDAKKEQELENLQIQTCTILNSLSNMVILFDRDNKAIMCNKAFETTAEMDGRNVLGKGFLELKEKLQFRRKEEPPESMPEGYAREAYEASFTTAGGKRKDIVFQHAPISNVDGELIGRIVVASDVTELKNNQQKLQQWEKLSLLGEMAAGVVHEIKNPLTTIKGFSSIIASRVSNESVRNYACLIESTADEVDRVVSDFLAFARPRSPVLEEISMNDLIRSMKLVLESHLFIKGVDFNLCLSNEEKSVMADVCQIRQVIVNMVNNAVTAMDETTNPRLLISTGLSDNREEMCITISDNGRGMTQEEKIKLGTPFFTARERGTGLGLSICYQIVNKHGGKISVKSKPLIGTAFTLTLPCTITASERLAAMPGAQVPGSRPSIALFTSPISDSQLPIRTS